MRNRVTPMGDIVAVPLRGGWTGNRGNIHRGTAIVRFHGGSLWIICALQFRDYRMTQWAPGRYTVLFFHDEAVALAAGHRPCALCRRADYQAFRTAWAVGRGEGNVPSAAEMDRQLHSERLVRGTHQRRLHRASWPTLPDGSFVALDSGPALMLGDALIPWTTAGYGSPRSRPIAGTADTITPPSIVAALVGGYRPQIDAGARSVLQRD